MPIRSTPLVNGQYYHILNRGVARAPIFLNNRDRQRFTDTFIYYVNGQIPVRYSLSNKESNEKTLAKPENQIVDIISYCFMPNHFHFLIKQNVEDGIKNFIRKTTNSYVRYFNLKHKRKGPLFEGVFKAILVTSNEQLLHLTRYIHLNPLVGAVVNNLNSYRWSSYPEFLGYTSSQVCSKEIILNQFKSSKDYERFVLDHEDYGRELEKIKHQILEDKSEFPGVYTQNTPGV